MQILENRYILCSTESNWIFEYSFFLLIFNILAVTPKISWGTRPRRRGMGSGICSRSNNENRL